MRDLPILSTIYNYEKIRFKDSSCRPNSRTRTYIHINLNSFHITQIHHIVAPKIISKHQLKSFFLSLCSTANLRKQTGLTIKEYTLKIYVEMFYYFFYQISEIKLINNFNLVIDLPSQCRPDHPPPQ